MSKDRTRTASATRTVPAIPAPCRESVSRTERVTEPLPPAAAAALDRLYSRIFGVSEAV